MKKLFGVKIGSPAEIIASLPILEVLTNSLGETYNIFVLGKKYEYFSFFLENHPLINEIYISGHEENLSKNDFELIKKCDYFINPTPPNLKENDWYNYRSLIQETCLNATIDFNLIKNFPKLYRRLNQEKVHTLGINQDPQGPSKEWWQKLISNIGLDFICLNKYTNFSDRVKAALSCEIILSPPSDLSWTVSAMAENHQVNLISKYKVDHISNITSLAPVGEKTTNIINTNSYNDIDIFKTIEIIKNLKYNQ
jgi:hypothetical protein